MMPNIRKQIVGDLSELGGVFIGQTGIHIVASNGKSITLTQAQIAAHLAVAIGVNLVAKATATQTWMASQIEVALGTEMVPASKCAPTINNITGVPTGMGVFS